MVPRTKSLRSRRRGLSRYALGVKFWLVLIKHAHAMVQVHHTPSGTTEATIRSAAKRLGVIKVRAVVRVHPQGTIVVVLYDLRDAMRIVNGLQGKTLAQLGCSPVRNSPGSLDASFGPSEREHEDGAPLRVEYTDRKTLEKVSRGFILRRSNADVINTTAAPSSLKRLVWN